MPWTLFLVLSFFLWLLLFVLFFFLKTQQRVSVQVELSAFRGRRRVKKLDVRVDSNCNLLLGSSICALCGLADETATETHTHRDTACTQLYTHNRRSSWKKSRASSEDNMEFIHSADSHLLNVFLTLCHQLDLRLARWWSQGGCEMLTVRACAFISDAVCNSGCCSKTNNSWHSDYSECASVYGNRSQMRLNGNQRGDSHKRIPLI